MRNPFQHCAASNRFLIRNLLSFVMTLAIIASLSDRASAQSGLRESLERLDRNVNGKIEPEEITPLARPYLERVAKSRQMSLDRPNDIDKLQEAARIYFALVNGVAGRGVDPDLESSVKGFGPLKDEPMVPEFGLPEIKYRYVQADLDEADRTLRRYDRNKDGSIDRNEARRGEWTHRDPFEEDSNFDGRLSRMELGQRYARRRLLDGASDELVKRARRVGNGIRPSAVPEGRQDDSRWWRQGGSRFYLTATVLGRFDLNRNGRLEADEAVNLGIPTSQVDLDRNGELSRDELHTFLTELQDEAGDDTLGLPTWFFERDVNRDDQVTMAEYADEWSQESIDQFTALDINDDGILTKSEVVNSASMMGGNFTNDDAEILPPHKTVISEIAIEQDVMIADLNVQLSITHSHVSHLDAYLISPEGARVELFTEVGGHDDHFSQTIFDDQSREPITKGRPPFEGSYLPEAVLKGQPGLWQFNGKNAAGVWQLVIAGMRSERFGILHRWSLIIKPMDRVDPTTPPVVASSQSAAGEESTGQKSLP